LNTGRHLKGESMRKQVDGRALLARAAAYLAEHEPVCAAFHKAVQPLFAGMWAKALEALPGGGRPARKPPISLRLIAGGTPVARVVFARPGSRGRGERESSGIAGELIQERLVSTGEGEEKSWTRRLTFSLGPPRAHRFYTTVLEDAARVVAVMRDFLADR